MFIIASGILGFIGAFYSATIGGTSLQIFSLDLLLLMLAMIVIGGLGNPIGALLGATILILMPELLRAWSDYRLLLYGMALVLIILMRPSGLLDRRFGPSWLVRRLGGSQRC